MGASGLTPKAVGRVLRFERALRLIRQGRELTAVAYDCGYADQPHLDREFRALAGSTPREVTFVQDRRDPGLASAPCPSIQHCATATPPEAIEWLERALGCETVERHDNPDGTVAHAELRLGDGLIMLGSGAAGLQEPPDDARAARATIYVALADVDALHARAKAAGADVSDLVEQDYGSRDFNTRDPEGNHWSFGTYVPQGPSR